MPIGFRGAAASPGTTGTTLTVTVPAAAQVGDVAYLAFTQGGGQTATVSSSGGTTWTTDTNIQVLNGTTRRMYVYERTLTAADLGSTVTVTFAASQIAAGGIIVLSGASGRNAFSAGTNKTVSSTTNTFASVTPPVADEAIVYFSATQLPTSSATVVTSSTPTGYTEVTDSSQSGTNIHTALSMGYQLLTGNAGVAQTVPAITLSTSAGGLTLAIAVAPTPAVAYAATASGQSVTGGSAAALLAEAATASGQSVTGGSAAAGVRLIASASGQAVTAGSAAATSALAASASGQAVTGGTAIQRATLVASASGQAVTSGSAAATISAPAGTALAATASGQSVTGGTATAGVLLVASGSGQSVTAGTAAGGIRMPV